MAKEKQTPTAGDKADTKSAAQSADRLLLPNGMPYEEGRNPDGTIWQKLIPADDSPRPVHRPNSAAELIEWIRGRQATLLGSNDAIMVVWPDNLANLLDGARSLGITPPTPSFDPHNRHEVLAYIDTLLRCLSEAPAATDAKPKSDESSLAPPSVILASWREILIALGMKNNREDQGKVSRLSKGYNGPIRFPGQGKQPLVDKVKLIAWWNRLEIELQDRENQARGSKADAESGHSFGRTGKAVPSIGGGVKQRRRDRKP